MSFRFGNRLRVAAIGLAILALALSLTFSFAGRSTPTAKASPKTPFCAGHAQFCTETREPWGYDGTYTGHDEPSVLFYSNTAGAGNSSLYQLTLPKQPASLPKQDGSGSTWDFQLHPAFWFGMAMCDDQSAPNPGGSTVAGNSEPNVLCTPDSDTNIYTSTNPADPNYIGRGPGVAFMEMQFYPPGWSAWPAGVSCSARQWCAALTIDSLTENQNTGQPNNSACLNAVGIEPVNFAFITKTGAAHAPANPVDATAATYTPNSATDLFMNSGDKLTVDLHDTANGLQIGIQDLTTSQSGSMTASAANQFGEVKWDPTGTTCQAIPYNYHPMYSTSSENTRVVWAAHSYNVAYSDEIGHFEYCTGVDAKTGTCHGSSVNDAAGLDGDDAGCFSPSQSYLVRIGGCIATDVDFDGVNYQPGAWPGNGNDANTPTPIIFTSPLFNGTQNYDRVAFETDLPRIEIPSCNRGTGDGCVNPPNGANFYPFYNASTSGGQCAWYEGGPGTPHNTYSGGSSATEFGALLKLTYPTIGGTVQRYNDFRNVLPSNPCTA
ncbi:MAG TPA: hypothetical protein VFU88_16025 [Ktedonobacterales bacterium]|nr:hypothetical protein [Ktedonobacterales bacterium]